MQTYIIIAFSEWVSDPFILSKVSVSSTVFQKNSAENNTDADTVLLCFQYMKGAFSAYADFQRVSHHSLEYL